MESTIGKRIRQLREAKGLTVADFAKCAGVKASAIYGLESDANKPSIETVTMLRKSFSDLNTEWLQFGEGSMYKNAPTSATSPTPVEPETAAEVVAPSIVKRKVNRPLMVAEPNLDHLSPEKKAEYWEQRYKKEIRRQAEEFEAAEHQETLQLINFRSASSGTADLYQLTNALASYLPMLSAEKLDALHAMPKFKPAPRVIPMYTAPGFKVGTQKQA